MTDEVKNEILELRSAGCSYGQISRLLGLNRSTVSNYCLRNNISAPDKDAFGVIMHGYGFCLQCGKLFKLSRQIAKRFCSDKCRTKYWQQEAKYQQDLEEKAEELMTLTERLDFSEDLRDELDGTEEIHLCCHSINNNGKGGKNEKCESQPNKHPPHSLPDTP